MEISKISLSVLWCKSYGLYDILNFVWAGLHYLFILPPPHQSAMNVVPEAVFLILKSEHNNI